MRVASNTSPLFNLAVIGQLHLLAAQYEQVLIPEAVAAELEPVRGRGGVGAIHAARDDGWISVVPVRDRRTVGLLTQELHPGEAEAIALAVEAGLSGVLIDETDGRRVARRMGLTPLGVLGILLRAKHDGRLASVKAAISALQNDAGFHLHPDLVRQVLASAEEG